MTQEATPSYRTPAPAPPSVEDRLARLELVVERRTRTLLVLSLVALLIAIARLTILVFVGIR